MISVIVPVYNTEKYLDRCVQSILAQTYTDFELLLIDDGSTDSSGAMCDRYAEQDSRVRVFHKENGGVSSARNLGLDNAIGEWITFCDSDDFVYQDWLANYDISNSINPDLICQGVECSIKLSSSDRNEKYSFNFGGLIKDGLLLLHEYHILGYVFIKLFKKNIIDAYRIRFDEQLKFKEDELFVLSYMTHCETMLSFKKIGYYYYVPDWCNKYRETAYNFNLEQKLSVYDSIIEIYKDETNILTDKYLLDLVGETLCLYKLNRCSYKTFKIVAGKTQRYICRLSQLSHITKTLWRKSSLVTHIFLVLKSRLLQ